MKTEDKKTLKELWILDRAAALNQLSSIATHTQEHTDHEGDVWRTAQQAAKDENKEGAEHGPYMKALLAGCASRPSRYEHLAHMPEAIEYQTKSCSAKSQVVKRSLTIVAG
eukprot:16450148-Heterocapsa_arctica.AAC.1